jgi:O-antigen ligase
MWLLAALLWYGILTMRVPSRWPITGFELGVFALAVVLVVRRRFAIHFHPVSLALAAGALWALLQAGLGVSIDPQRSLEASLQWTLNCAAFSLALALTGDRLLRRRFLTAQVLFALLAGVACVIALFTTGQLGPFAYYNQFAAFLEPALAIAIAASLWDHRRPLLWILVAAALFACVVAGGSRAGSILCLALLILLPLIAYTRGRMRARALARVAILGLASAAVLIAVVGWEKIWQRLQEPHPYALRANLVRSSLAMVGDRPLTGFGLGAWSSVYPAYARYDDGTFVNQAHNGWVQWAAEGGLPFFLLMLIAVATLARPAWRSLWGLGLMAVFLHALVDYPFEQRPALAAYFFALAGALAAEANSSISSPGENSPDGPSRASLRSRSSLRAD